MIPMIEEIEMNLHVGAMLCAAAGAVAFFATGAWGQFHEQPGVIVLSARRLAALEKHPVSVPAGGTWHAWAWQRGGSQVDWTVTGKSFSASAPSDADGAFAWIKLGGVDLAADKPVAAAFTLRGPKEADAVAALLLARQADCDPAGVWQLTRVFPDAPLAAADERLGRCRHLNMRMTMPTYATKGAWEKRAAFLREHVRVSCGLLPEPPRTPLKPHISGKLERDGYTVEKAYFESRPGFYCCGNLYRPFDGAQGKPRDRKAPFPAVASPHGHWGEGRLAEAVIARCISLARLGYVVFSYDMVGYNDSGKQVGKHRGVFTTPHNELWGLSMMHLQSWNTIRAIDFLQSLADVDPRRIGLTGCSGGGTQTFMVMGIEDRVTAAAPVCMVSGIMQGGCECENAPLLRIETNNIEIAALMAPRPLIVPSVSGDWTKETPKVEYPSIRGVYELYGAAERVANTHIKSGHGYPQPHRQAVYGFFDRWIRGRGDGKPIPEPACQAEKKEDLLVFYGRKLPADAKTPATLKKHIIAECRRQRDELLPARPEQRKRFEETLGAAYRHAILAELPKARELAVKDLGSSAVGDVQVTRLLLGRKGVGDHVPAILYRRKGASGKQPACVVVHPDGKAALIDAAGCRPDSLLAGLLADGRMVLGVDTYLTGEFLSPQVNVEQKKEGGFFSTYNRTPLVQRVQDILTALAYLARRKDVTATSLIGVGQAGAWCLLAAPLAPESTSVAADLDGLGGDDDPRWLGDLFTPCILKAGGPQTAVALAAPRRVFLHHLADGFDTKPLRAAYRAAGAPQRLRLEARRCGPDALVRWLGSE